MALSETLRTRLRQSPGLGGAPLGNLFRTLSDRTAIALVRYAHAAGARYFDTAPHYGHGRSERRLGDALDGGFPALATLKADGTIGGYGLGVNDVAICREVLRHADLDVILLAGRYTLADQSALPELLPECHRRGVIIVLGGPFNSGILATGARPRDGSVPHFNYAPAPRAVVEHVAAIERVSAAFAVPLPAASLQFPLRHPAAPCVLPGARSAAEFDETLRNARYPSPARFWRALRDQHLTDP